MIASMGIPLHIMLLCVLMLNAKINLCHEEKTISVIISNCGREFEYPTPNFLAISYKGAYLGDIFSPPCYITISKPAEITDICVKLKGTHEIHEENFFKFQIQEESERKSVNNTDLIRGSCFSSTKFYAIFYPSYVLYNLNVRLYTKPGQEQTKHVMKSTCGKSFLLPSVLTLVLDYQMDTFGGDLTQPCYIRFNRTSKVHQMCVRTNSSTATHHQRNTDFFTLETLGHSHKHMTNFSALESGKCFQVDECYVLLDQRFPSFDMKVYIYPKTENDTWDVEDASNSSSIHGEKRKESVEHKTGAQCLLQDDDPVVYILAAVILGLVFLLVTVVLWFCIWYLKDLSAKTRGETCFGRLLNMFKRNRNLTSKDNGYCGTSDCKPQSDESVPLQMDCNGTGNHTIQVE